MNHFKKGDFRANYCFQTLIVVIEVNKIQRLLNKNGQFKLSFIESKSCASPKIWFERPNGKNTKWSSMLWLLFLNYKKFLIWKFHMVPLHLIYTIKLANSSYQSLLMLQSWSPWPTIFANNTFGIQWMFISILAINFEYYFAHQKWQRRKF